MSKGAFVRGVNVLCAFAMISSVAATAMAQQAPVRVIQGSDGTLYVVHGSNSWTLVPDQASDSDVAELNPSGEIAGTFPNELLAVQAPPAPRAPVPAPQPSPTPPAPTVPAAPTAAQSPGAWQGVTEMWVTNWGPLTITYGGKGAWLQGGSTGQITISQYDPKSHVLTFTYYQPWNQQEGQAMLTIAPGGQGFNGTWRQRTLGVRPKSPYLDPKRP